MNSRELVHEILYLLLLVVLVIRQKRRRSLSSDEVKSFTLLFLFYR